MGIRAQDLYVAYAGSTAEAKGRQCIYIYQLQLPLTQLQICVVHKINSNSSKHHFIQAWK